MAEAAGLPAASIAGDAVETEALVTGMKTLRARAENAEKELGERDRRLKGMEEELRELDARLGGATTERDRLLMKQAAEQRMREQVSAIEQQLSPDEARIIQAARQTDPAAHRPVVPGGFCATQAQRRTTAAEGQLRRSPCSRARASSSKDIPTQPAIPDPINVCQKRAPRPSRAG